MSMHHSISPEVVAKLKLQKRNNTIAAIVIAILLCMLIGLLFWMLKYFIPSRHVEPIVSYIADSSDIEEVVKQKVVNEVRKKPSSPSSSAVSIITANAPSEISIPTPEIEIETLSVDFGESDGFGDGWGNGSGDGFGGGGGSFSMFGKIGGAGLKGTFYDLKQDKRKRMTSIGKVFQNHTLEGGFEQRIRVVKNAVGSLKGSRFHSSNMKNYFRAETALTFTNLVIAPSTNADEATKAFKVGDQAKASAWVVVYEGKISAPNPNAYYRFCGSFDDYMYVYVNGRLVLDAPHNYVKFGSATAEVKHGLHMNDEAPLRCGKYIRLGKKSDIKIVICESPGGHMGGGLFIQEKGKNYHKDNRGGSILPPFTTESLRQEDKDRMNGIQRLQGGHFPIELNDVPVFSVVK